MKAFYCDQFVLPLPPEHTFPMAKYAGLHERLVADGIVAASDLRVPPAADWDDVTRMHTYPFRKETSDLDVTLPDGAEDAAYLDALAPALDRALAGPRFDLAFCVAGADPYAGDRFGRLRLTIDGLVARDRLVFGRYRAEGLPVAVVMGGGYTRDVDVIVSIHANTIRALAELSPSHPPLQENAHGPRAD